MKYVALLYVVWGSPFFLAVNVGVKYPLGTSVITVSLQTQRLNGQLCCWLASGPMACPWDVQWIGAEERSWPGLNLFQARYNALHFQWCRSLISASGAGHTGSTSTARLHPETLHWTSDTSYPPCIALAHNGCLPSSALECHCVRSTEAKKKKKTHENMNPLNIEIKTAFHLRFCSISFERIPLSGYGTTERGNHLCCECLTRDVYGVCSPSSTPVWAKYRYIPRHRYSWSWHLFAVLLWRSCYFRPQRSL